jgi:epoxyqueuosine reductase
LTIELKGAIPREIRPLIGNWIFGCDACQDCCPVNGKAKPVEFNWLAPADDFEPWPVLVDLLSLDDVTFRSKFNSTPLQRAKKRGLQRNAAVALGNCGDSSTIPALVQALDSPEALVRGHSAWALGRLKGRNARAALEAHLTREENSFVQEELQLALGSL